MRLVVRLQCRATAGLLRQCDVVESCARETNCVGKLTRTLTHTRARTHTDGDTDDTYANAVHTHKNKQVRRAARLDEHRHAQRVLPESTKASQAGLYTIQLEANEQITLVSTLILGAATSLLYQEVDPDAMDPRVWGTHRVFLAATIALNLYAVTNLTIQSFFAKKSVRAEHTHTDCIDADADPLDHDQQVMFVKRTHKLRTCAIAACVTSIPCFGVAMALGELRCEFEGACSFLEVFPAVIIGVVIFGMLWSVHSQSQVYNTEKIQAKRWHAANSDATQHIQAMYPELGPSQMNAVVRCMELVKARVGDVILKEGDRQCDAFYLVRSGAVRVTVKDKATGKSKVLSTVHRGGTFGEFGLNTNSSCRKATVTAVMAGTEQGGGGSGTVEVWEIRRDVYRTYLMRVMMNKRIHYSKLLKTCAVFKDLDPVELHGVAGALELVEFKEGAVVMYEGETTNDLYMIVEGQADITVSSCINDVTNPTGSVHTSNQGDVFGEIALVTNQPRTATVTAKEGTLRCVKLTRDRFLVTEGKLEQLLKAKARAILAKNEAVLRFRSGAAAVIRRPSEMFKYEDTTFQVLERLEGVNECEDNINKFHL